MKKIKELLSRLRLAGLLDGDRLDRLDALCAAAEPDVEAIGSELVAAFDEADGPDADAEKVAAMALLASAVSEVRDRPAPPPRPPLSAANAHRSAGSRPRVTGTPAARAQLSALTAAGAALESEPDVRRAFREAVEAVGRGGTERALAFTARTTYPEERQLTTDSAESTRRIDAVVGREALVASGGICNPVGVDYSVPVFASRDRPIRDALPSFGATRGGVRFLQPPTFANVGASATAVWTEATDVNPGGATKPVQTITCGSEVEVFVDAIPTRVKLGNFMSRFSSEYSDAVLELVVANAARVAELNLLSKISTASTVVSSGQLLGAARDLLATIELATEAYIYRNRLPVDTTLRCLMPAWARGLIQADLIRSLAHGQDASNLSVSDAEVTSLLQARGVTVSWYEDGQAAQGSGVTYPFQGFGTQGANATLLDWPARLSWFLFAEGTFQFLDGGRLDVGIVRDSVLNSTNDLESFTESFEGVALRGSESLQIVSAVRANGATAGTVQTATSPAIY